MRRSRVEKRRGDATGCGRQRASRAKPGKPKRSCTNVKNYISMTASRSSDQALAFEQSNDNIPSCIGVKTRERVLVVSRENTESVRKEFNPTFEHSRPLPAFVCAREESPSFCASRPIRPHAAKEASSKIEMFGNSPSLYTRSMLNSRVRWPRHTVTLTSTQLLHIVLIITIIAIAC